MKLHCVPHRFDDWLIKTADIGPAERGIYDTLCNLIWSTGGPIINTEHVLARRCCCHWRQFRRHLKTLLDHGFVRIIDGHIHVTTAAQTLQEARKTQLSRSDVDIFRHQPDLPGIEQESFPLNGFPLRKTPPLPPKESPPSLKPPSENAAAAPPPTKEQSNATRGSRLPPDWQPDAACTAFAAGCGLDPGRIAAEFRDYWHAKPGAGGVKLDWCATWRNWCRKAEPGPNGYAAAGLQRPLPYSTPSPRYDGPTAGSYLALDQLLDELGLPKRGPS